MFRTILNKSWSLWHWQYYLDFFPQKLPRQTSGRTDGHKYKIMFLCRGGANIKILNRQIRLAERHGYRSPPRLFQYLLLLIKTYGCRARAKRVQSLIKFYRKPKRCTSADTLSRTLKLYFCTKVSKKFYFTLHFAFYELNSTVEITSKDLSVCRQNHLHCV